MQCCQKPLSPGRTLGRYDGQGYAECRLYPTAKQETVMRAIKRGYQQLYNAALEQRRAAWRRQRHLVPRTAQEKDLTQLCAEDAEIRLTQRPIIPVDAQAA